MSDTAGLSDAAIGRIVAALVAGILALVKFGPKLKKALLAKERVSAIELAEARIPGAVECLELRMADLESERERARAMRARLVARAAANELRMLAIESQVALWRVLSERRTAEMQQLRSDLNDLRKDHDQCSVRGGASQLDIVRIASRLDSAEHRLTSISSAHWSAQKGGGE